MATTNADTTRSSTATQQQINQIIKTLNLEPHPEGGYFKETFRDDTKIDVGRAASTSIYYLLPESQLSLLHRIDASEGWHHYAGGTLQVIELDVSGPVVTKLGKDLNAGERPQYTVKAGRWFGAKPVEGSGYCLVGCTVAPGFQFEKFEFGKRNLLLKEFGACNEWIETLTGEN